MAKTADYNLLVSLNTCKSLIEQQLNWPASQHWRHKEFLDLSDKVFDKTGVALSVNTLKRLWGKLEYTHTPNPATLDALAKFLDFESWMAFVTEISSNSTVSKEPSFSHQPFIRIFEKIVIPDIKRFVQVLTGLAMLSIGGFVYLNWSIYQPENRTSDLARVSFSSRQVDQGVPNTVIFTYDVRGITANDFYIQQNWDDRRKFKIDPQQFQATSTYYFPGYWRAKIIAATDILQEHDILITSEGWLSTLDTELTPRYIGKDLLGSDGLCVAADAFMDMTKGINELPWLTFHLVDHFQDLDMDNLELELVFRNPYDGGNAVCKNTDIILLGSGGIFRLPFSIPGCVGTLNVRFNDFAKEGKTNDLSSYGLQMDNWQKVKCHIMDRSVVLSINDEIIDKFSYTESAGNFYGIRVKFKGNGMVRSGSVRSTVDTTVFYNLIN